MNKKLVYTILALTATLSASAQQRYHVAIKNTRNAAVADFPVTIDIRNSKNVKSANVTVDGKEIPYQIDDLDGDGSADEICFLVNLENKQTQNATVTLSGKADGRKWKPRTFAEMVLRNPKVKEKNRHDIYLSSITIDKRTTNPYNVLHHHGVAFESELIAMRIYMDKRQTIDLYGKFHKGLELEQTQFYTSAEQKAQGYGDDVLWVGNTFGLGALRGWNGESPTMLDEVEHRTQRILATGPLRTIVEVEDNQWIVAPGTEPVNAVIRYTLYAGHRDFDVDVTFNKDVAALDFSTGIINIKGSKEYTDHKGLRGCWGTDWPAGTSDTIKWKRETVGLGIYIPDTYRKTEMPADKDNYTYIVKPAANRIHYSLTYTSDNEDFGYHSDSDWFAFLKEWKQQLTHKPSITITEE